MRISSHNNSNLAFETVMWKQLQEGLKRQNELESLIKTEKKYQLNSNTEDTKTCFKENGKVPISNKVVRTSSANDVV